MYVFFFYLLHVECGEYDVKEERSIEKGSRGCTGTPERVNVVCECSGRQIFTGPGIRTSYRVSFMMGSPEF